VLSVAAMAQWLRISRTHMARKLADAEEMGSIGWQGRRGHSVMWVSAGFRREYAMAQATKLPIIDTAFSACVRQIPVAALTAMLPRELIAVRW
jgi:hypothetical protein